ncbi:hypothetical protein ACJMK2_004916 [Sinanodonta woodiana]|uniref:Uncharacterized protein n=1 Tax=Sinanodonta woodiana TaxID=1069815 RepID=A0ABD3VNH4_SINWO
MTRGMGRTPNRRETSSSEVMSHPGTPEWISGAQVIFKTPNSAMKPTRNRRTSIYQGRKSPQKQDIDSKQTPNGRFKVPVPFVISPPGVKTRARRSSIYQKAGAKNVVNLSFSPPKEGVHARATRKTSSMISETKKSPISTSRRKSMIIPGKKNSSAGTHTRQTSRLSVYMKNGKESTILTSVIEKADINSKVMSSNSASDTVIIQLPAGKKSPGSSTKKRKARSAFNLPSPGFSPTAEKARSDQESPSASPASRQSSRKASKNPSIRAASKTPKRKMNIPEQTSTPIEVVAFEVQTPDNRGGENALSNKSANKVKRTPAAKRKSSSPGKERNSPLKSPTPVESLASVDKSPHLMMDQNSSAKKRRISSVKCPSPKKLKTPGKHQVSLKSPSLNKVKTPVSQQIILKPKLTPAEKLSSLQTPASNSPKSRRKNNNSADMSTLSVEDKNSSFVKRKRSATPLKQEKQQTPSVSKKSKLSSTARTGTPSAEPVKSATKTVHELTTSPPMQCRQQTPSVSKTLNLSSPAEKTVHEVTVELPNRRNSCYSTPMSTSSVVVNKSAKRKRSASPSKQDKQQSPSASKRFKLSSPTRTLSPSAGSVKSVEKSLQDVTVEMSHSEQKSTTMINNQKESLIQIKTSPKKQKAKKTAKVKSKKPTFGKKMKTITTKSSLEKTRTPTPGRPRKDVATDSTGFVRKKLIDGVSNGEKEVISILKSEFSKTDVKMQSTPNEDDSILNTTVSTDSRSSRCIIL